MTDQRTGVSGSSLVGDESQGYSSIGQVGCLLRRTGSTSGCGHAQGLQGDCPALVRQLCADRPTTSSSTKPRTTVSPCGAPTPTGVRPFLAPPRVVRGRLTGPPVGARTLHVGKCTAFGLGKFRCEAVT